MSATDSVTRRFAVACGVLSQYVRHGAPAGSAAAVAPAFLQPAGWTGAAVHEGGGSAQQLTIFYGGKVVVLDSCPPEKAAELIRLAAGAAPDQPLQAPAAPRAPVPVVAPALVDMPIARKASLRRFLSKRKDRATTAEPGPAPAAPYDRRDEEPAAKKGKVETSREEAASWLALGSLGSMHSR